ncbi:LysR family transcriptional regulator [Roseibium sp. SCP14]|uniref:LysR family transcriptional regulator n=1 Tax=Roseibium sp. SCP14 TaxID=3141375 RepID=UPI00333D10E1
MNVFRSMTVFSEVAKQGGFAPAARSMSLSTSAVSRHVIELEQWLGVELFQRTTRKLSLTDEGKRYLDRCQNVIDEVESIRNMASETLAAPRGNLRLTAPVFLARDCLQDLLPAYLHAYPEVNVTINAVDRFVDLVEEGFDLALRIGEISSSSLVSRKLMDIDLVVVASPEYLSKRGVPETPADLKHHNCIVDTAASYKNRWPMKFGSKRQSVAVKGNATVNKGDIARNLAVSGLGLTLLPRFFVLEQLHNKKLVSVLENQIYSNAGLYAVYPQSRQLTPKVTSFIDYVEAHIGQLKRRFSPG